MLNSQARVAEIKGVLQELGAAIAAMDPADLAPFVDELVHQVRPAKPSTSLKSAISGIGLTDNHRVRLARGVSVSLDDGALVRGDDRVQPPRPCLEALAQGAGQPVKVSQIRGVLPLEAVEPLLLRLLQDQWLTAV